MTRASPAAPARDWILDVGEGEFEREVLERSARTPVVVEFWAPWCGPCRTLGPLLERLAEEHAGAFALAKVDVDRAPALAQAFGVRGVPAVMGFVDGEIAAHFVGARPEPALRAFLEQLLPSEADRLADEAAARLAAGDLEAAESRLGRALELEPRSGRALVGMARLEAARGRVDEALALLERAAPSGRLGAERDRLAAELRTRRSGEADPEALHRRLEGSPDDLALRIELGRALAARQRHQEALETLLEALRRDPSFADDAARRAMLDLFEVLGPDHPLTRRFRPEMARTLYR